MLGAEIRQAVLDGGGGGGGGRRGGKAGGRAGASQNGASQNGNSQNGSGARLSLQEATRLLAALPADQLKEEVLQPCPCPCP